ncbi:MAG: hypothetical protein LBV00_12730 [Propionibacteriaceae bacterium]|nr:hypothetical protein [Propionibacteriaceae bacterium]
MDIAGLSTWLWIETGSNQEYIFATNKQRLQVAASAVVRSIGLEWIPEAVADVAKDRGQDESAYEVVIKASGLGVMLVPDVDFGSEVIRRVTERAVRERASIDLWGVTRDREPDESLAQSFEATKRLHSSARSSRPPVAARRQGNPFSARCAITNEPAAFLGPERGQYLSAEVATGWRAAKQARDALVSGLKVDDPDTNARIDQAIITAADLGAGIELRNNGWYGVLHADGNRVGSIFSNLGCGYDGAEWLACEKKLSQQMNTLMSSAVTDAILAVSKKTGVNQAQSWFLPIIIGGDDITAVMDARWALHFSHELAQAFEQRFNDPLESDFPSVLERLRQKDVTSVPDRLSLGMGLAFVKPHHPFNHAVALANDLAHSAKAFRTNASAIDVQAVFEPSVRPLEEIRAEMVVPGKHQFTPILGPFLVGDPARPSDASGAQLAPLEHSVATITALPEKLTEGSDRFTSRVAIAELREALAGGRDEDTYEASVNRALGQCGLWLRRRIPSDGKEAGEGDRIRRALDSDLRLEKLAPDQDMRWPGRFSIDGFFGGQASTLGEQPHRMALLTALELADVQRGTVEGQER